jgi:hypothetical protein
MNDGDSNEHRRRAGVLTWAQRGNRLRRLWGWLTAGSAGDTAVMVTGAVVIAATPALVAYDAMQSRHHAAVARQVLQAQPHAVKGEALGGAAMLYEVAGRDRQGRVAWFDFIVLSRGTVWVRGRTDQISREGALIDADAFKSVVIDRQLGARIAAARQLIAVGVASVEGEQASEEARAEARARRIAEWLVGAVPTNVPVWSLNLGQYQGVCSGCDQSVTDWQRPIIVVGLVNADAGVSLGEALQDALRGRANLPSPDRYSKFSFIRAR